MGDLTQHVTRLAERLGRLSKSMDILNNQTPTTGQKMPAVKEVMNFLIRDSAFLDQLLPRTVELGAALYQVSLQTAVFRHLLADPKRVSNYCIILISSYYCGNHIGFASVPLVYNCILFLLLCSCGTNYMLTARQSILKRLQRLQIW